MRDLSLIGRLNRNSNRPAYYKVAQTLEWTGQQEFLNASLRPWSLSESPISSHVAGETKSTKNGLLSWVTFDGAGHMVRRAQFGYGGLSTDNQMSSSMHGGVIVGPV